MAATDDVIETLSSFALFADLTPSELDGVAHTFDEEWFSEGQRVLRQGLSGTSFYLILDGRAGVTIDGRAYGELTKGDFFGEISVLLSHAPTADIVALTPLRCLVLPGSQLADWLKSLPSVCLRMLQIEARRLRNASEWRS